MILLNDSIRNMIRFIIRNVLASPDAARFREESLPGATRFQVGEWTPPTEAEPRMGRSKGSTTDCRAPAVTQSCPVQTW